MGIISAGLLQPAPLRIFGANLQKKNTTITKMRKLAWSILKRLILKSLPVL
jgi:hypothetical protein